MHPKLMELLLRYTGIRNIETKYEKDVYLKGILKIKDRFCRINMNCPHFPLLQEMRLQLLWQGQSSASVQSYTAADSCIDPDWTVVELFENLAQFQPQRTANSSNPISTVSVSPHELIYAQIAALFAPDIYDLHVDADCTRIRFDKFDQNDQHFLELQLQPTVRVRDHSLPESGAPPWPQNDGTTIATLLQLFQTHLERLQSFYENFTDIDELCYVAQPSPATTKHNWRLFLLRERVFLKLHIADPLAPFASLSVHIIGPTHEVEQLRHVYSEGLRSWDPDLDIHKNLLRIFDLCFFPMPPSIETAAAGPVDGAPACNICYCYQLEAGEIPTVSCDNPKCSVIFHAACLSKWFNSLSEGKVFLNVSFGACPFCKTKLSTSFGELLKN